MCVPFHLVDILKSNDRCADYVLMTQRSSKQLNEYSLNMQTSHVRVFNSFCLGFACVSIVFFLFWFVEKNFSDSLWVWKDAAAALFFVLHLGRCEQYTVCDCLATFDCKPFRCLCYLARSGRWTINVSILCVLVNVCLHFVLIFCLFVFWFGSSWKGKLLTFSRTLTYNMHSFILDIDFFGIILVFRYLYYWHRFYV